MKRFLRHCKRWNGWRKNNLNSPLHKFLVLIGLVYSPTFDFYCAFEDGEDMKTTV